MADTLRFFPHAAKSEKQKPEKQKAVKHRCGPLICAVGRLQQHTNVPQGVTEFRWSPTDEAMVLLIKDQSESELAAAEARKKGESAKPRPWTIDRLLFKKDNVGYLDHTRTHLHVLPKRGAEPVQLTFGNFDDSNRPGARTAKVLRSLVTARKNPIAI